MHLMSRSRLLIDRAGRCSEKCWRLFIRRPVHAASSGAEEHASDSALAAIYNPHSRSFSCRIQTEAHALADSRMRQAAARRDMQLTSRSRPLTPQDLTSFDYVIGMDASNLAAIQVRPNRVFKNVQTRARLRHRHVCLQPRRHPGQNRFMHGK